MKIRPVSEKIRFFKSIFNLRLRIVLEQMKPKDFFISLSLSLLVLSDQGKKIGVYIKRMVRESLVGDI